MQRNHLFTIDFSDNTITLCLFCKQFKKLVLKDVHSFYFEKSKDKLKADEFTLSEIKGFYLKNIKYMQNALAILPREETLVFFIEFPKAALENLQNVIDFEIEKYIPFAKKDVIYAYKIIKKTKTSVKVMLSAVKKDVFNSYTTLFENLGIKIDSIESKTSALCNFNELSKTAVSGESVLVNADDSSFEVISFKSGTITSSILVQPSDEAGYKDRLKSEVSAVSARDVHITGNNKNIARLAGESGLNELRLNEAHINASELVRSNSSRLAASIGSALAHYGITKRSINLIPAREELKENGFKNGAMAALSLAVIAGIIVWVFFLFSNQAKMLDLVNSRLGDFKQRAENVKLLSEETVKLNKELALIESLVEDDKELQEILKELTVRVPKDVWLNNFEYKGNKFYLRGFAVKASDLIFKLEESEMFKDVIFTSSIVKRREGFEEFNIQGEVY